MTTSPWTSEGGCGACGRSTSCGPCRVALGIPEPHTCTPAWESSTGPDRHGSLVVTEHCECGRTNTYTDSVI